MTVVAVVVAVKVVDPVAVETTVVFDARIQLQAPEISALECGCRMPQDLFARRLFSGVGPSCEGTVVVTSCVETVVKYVVT